jgi:hypothetical protein
MRLMVGLSPRDRPLAGVASRPSRRSTPGPLGTAEHWIANPHRCLASGMPERPEARSGVEVDGSNDKHVLLCAQCAPYVRPYAVPLGVGNTRECNLGHGLGPKSWQKY